MYVVVTGPPASGKSTLSRELARELSLPLLAKDTIKQALVETLGAADVEQSRLLGSAAVDVLLAVAAEASQAVLDSVWVDRASARARLAALDGVVEVVCECDVDTMRARYRARALHKGPEHFDGARDDQELWPPEALSPLAAGWPVVTVRTADMVDVREVAERVRQAAR